jgi:branched-chain amino acid aminotransferase
MSIVWVDGVLSAPEDARISPFDHALLTGDGVFETFRIYQGTCFACRRHLTRLERSAAGLRLPLPSRDELQSAMAAVVEANAITEGRLRVTVTGGASPLGSERGKGGPTVIVAASPMAPWPPTTDVVVVPWARNEHGALAGLKTVSYGENVVALAYARERGAGEAIFGNLAGNVCEGTGSNVFAVFHGRLVTPPLSAGCLAGVTRELVMEISGAAEEDIPLAGLADASEAFLTSSTREVQPIRAVDGVVLAAAPGPVATKTATAYTALVARTLDP